MTNILGEFLRGRDLAQQQALNQLKLQQAISMAPIEERLRQLSVDRAKQESQIRSQQIQSGELKQKAQSRQLNIEEMILAGSLAEQALSVEDEESRRAIIQSGLQRLGIESTPESVTDLDLRALVAQGKAADVRRAPTEYQELNLALQKERLDLERVRLEQSDDRLGIQANKLESSINSALQEALSRAKSRGAQIGKGEATKLIGAEDAAGIALNTMQTIDEILRHPGIDSALGIEAVINPANFIPGTDAYDFALKLDQLQGKAFLQAYESLKGGGQITEVEGKRAAEAVAQLSRKQSPEQFKASVNELKLIADKARANALKRINKEASGTGASGKTRIKINLDGEIVE